MRRVAEILLAAAVLATSAALPAAPQTLAIQSGEHADFTRLVLPIGAGREWELTRQADERWGLTLDPPADGFDTSAIFDFIPRTRLESVEAGDTLTLLLACSCNVSTFRHATEYLVIDISEAEPDAEPTIPDAAALPQDRAAAAAALPDLSALLQQPEGLPNIAAPLEEEPAASEGQPPEPPTANPRLEEAAQIMAEQLARAAAAGLLDVSLDQPMTVGDPVAAPSAPSPETRADETIEAPARHDEAAEAGDEEPPLPVHAETAFDNSGPLDRPLSPPRAEASCTGEAFDVAEWSDGSGVHHDLGALRRDLYDERDVLTRDGALALARHYLYYGFGAEARHWLSQLSDPPRPLLHLATIVDGAQTAAFTPVSTAEGCSQGELLWRYLAGAVTNPLLAEDTAAIQRAFGDLPLALRDHMGPRLASQLLDDGYAGTARNVRDVLHRGGRIAASDLQALDLSLGISLDQTEAAIRYDLAEALRDDGDDPVTILTHALAFDRHAGTPPPPARLVTADALIREHGEGPETDDLWREALLGHAAHGQIDEALHRLANPARAPEVRARALTELITDRVDVGDTATLVILAYTHGRSWRPQGSAAGRVQVRAIAALRAEGLFEAAQILRDVRRPLILPAPETADEATPDPATRAWQERDWEGLAETGEGPHADVATRLTQLEDTPPAPSGPTGAPDLEALNATLEDSRALRSALATLLAEPALP